MSDTENTRKHTLERIIDAQGSKFNEQKLHGALLLAFAHSAYSVISKDCVPSPMYRIKYDKKNNVFTMDETFGLSLQPDPEALDVSVMDEIFCCNIRDIPLLMEGETGIGKTYAAMKYLSTVFVPENYFSYRLSANSFVNNLFSPFQEGKMVNGMPVISVKTDMIERCAAGIIDELNRGDSNESLQMLDNEMHLNGVVYKLGIHVPEIKETQDEKNQKTNFRLKGDKLKKLLLICAQNPASADDAKFTQTVQLDAAVDNRLLKTYVGNASPSVGSALWLGEATKKPHEEFILRFKKTAVANLGIEEAALSDIGEDWLSIYAWITESGKTDKPILYSGLELADFMTAVLSGDFITYFNYEKKIINSYAEIFGGDDFKVTVELAATKRVQQINEVVKSFKVPFIFRDIVQIEKTADVLATLKNIKDSLRDVDPVKKYMGLAKCVTVREVAEATALVARNKQPLGKSSPVPEINEILTQYVSLLQDYMRDAKLLTSNFNLHDDKAGLKNIVIQKSLRDAIANGRNADYLVGKIMDNTKRLLGKLSLSEDLKNIMIVRSTADLLTLCSFLRDYKGEVNAIFKTYNAKTAPSTVMKDLGSFYLHKQDATAMVMPDIYQHRIRRTLGV